MKQIKKNLNRLSMLNKFKKMMQKTSKNTKNLETNNQAKFRRQTQ